MNGLLDFLRGKFVRTDRTPISAVATADNIVVASASGRVPLVVQGFTGGGANALEVYANGGNRLVVDNNGSCQLLGALVLRYNAITPTTTPGTAIAVPRCVLPVGDAVTASRHVQLPAANAVGAGHTVIVMDLAGTAATGNITINRAGSDTITTTTAGNTSTTITANGGVAIFISDGSSIWKRMLLVG